MQVLEPLEPRHLLASSISGTVFDDANADGVMGAGETGLKSQTVYLDQNFNGQFDVGEPSTLTDKDGQYSFSVQDVGVYRLRVVVPTNWRQTAPAANFSDVTVSGFSDIKTGIDFGMTTTAIVRGNVFNDANGDGVKEMTETSLPGVTVYIDKNNNGKLDKNEKSRVSDADGNYRFRGLTPGTYVFRVVLPKGTALTAPSLGYYKLKLKSGQSLSNRNFGIMTA